jgi:chorismate dehydratase
MLRLGHIVYSNCFPVHARFIHDAPPPGVSLMAGVPSLLNDLLARGVIDVAPSSSIEYARHGGRYRLLPDVVIGSRGAVNSILLVGAPPEMLEGKVVALPTASATSVVLLKILLRTRWRVAPRFTWFDQAADNPFALGAAAALYIGDIALRPDLHPRAPARVDLGAEWYAETGLPFAFALWQAGGGSAAALRTLLNALVDSRAFWRERRSDLAERHAATFGLSARALEKYWSGLQFELDASMVEGLRAFYRMAVEIGEIGAAPSLEWI